MKLRSRMLWGDHEMRPMPMPMILGLRVGAEAGILEDELDGLYQSGFPATLYAIASASWLQLGGWL